MCGDGGHNHRKGKAIDLCGLGTHMYCGLGTHMYCLLQKDINIASEMVALGHMEWIQDILPGVCAGSTAVPTYLSLPPVGSVFTAFVTSVHTPELLFIQVSYLNLVLHK